MSSAGPGLGAGTKDSALQNRGSGRFSFSARDGFTSVLCLTGTALCLWLFWAELNQTFIRQNADPIGTISWKYKAAQRRFGDRVLWHRISRDSPVYSGDFIRTEALSEATIILSDSTKISLEENSLIEISLKDNILRISGASGTLGVTAGSGELLLETGDKTIRAASGSVLTLSAGDGGRNLWVSEGTVSVDDPGGPILAESGDVVLLDPAPPEDAPVLPDASGPPDVSGAPAGQPPRTAVFSPPPDAVFFTPGETAAVNFRFNPLDYRDEVTRLEISPSRRFSRSVIRRDLTGPEATVELESGVWWWRAWPQSPGPEGGGEETGPHPQAVSGRLTVRRTPAPVPVFPSRQAELNSSQVRFRWTLPKGMEAEGYVLEMADNPDFANPEPFLETADSSLSVPLENGRWYWRVRARYTGPSGFFDGPNSETLSFTIRQKILPPAPAAPRDGSGLALNKRVYFSWQDQGRGPWTITVSASPDLGSPLITVNTLSAYYSEVLNPGRYYWQVTGSGGVSPVWSFTVAERPAAPPVVSAPQVTAPPPAASAPPEPPPPVESAPPEIPPPVESAPPETPPPAASAPPEPPPPAPSLRSLSPADKTVFGAAQLRGIDAISFAWDPVPGAALYRFTIVGPDGREVLSQTTGNPSFRLVDLSILSRGTFTWRVEDLDSGVSAESRFTIELPELRSEPLNNPGVLYGR
ncbi:MAG: FecR family protein [Treponema sp.]|jgi:hypothetical protein|nr:FecR family protein [Treponema sp.]